MVDLSDSAPLQHQYGGVFYTCRYFDTQVSKMREAIVLRIGIMYIYLLHENEKTLYSPCVESRPLIGGQI
jgi:hypothetical protein